MKKKDIVLLVIISLYFIFLLISVPAHFQPGREIGKNFISYALEMIKILPFAFILIGLFEVWIKKETVEKHLGKEAGFTGFLWAILLGGTTIGPMIVALPIAYSLFKKGARLQVVFTYVGAAGVCRIPMTILEASYLGIKFTAIRYVVSIPLIVISSSLLGKYLERKNYQIVGEDSH